MSWSLDAHDLDLLAIQADERLLTMVGARHHVEVADPAIGVLTALAREVDATPIPTGLVGLRPVGQPTGAGRPARRRAALTGMAAAVAVLSIGAAAAAVGGAPVSSVIRDTVGSVFKGNSGPSTADRVIGKLGDANAALTHGDARRAKEILEDIRVQVEESDPGEVPPGLVEQVKQLESQVEAAESPLPAPADTSLASPPGPAGTIGGEAMPADDEDDGNEEGGGTNQSQGQEESDDEATPTSEPTPTPEPSEPAEQSPTPSAEPTPSPSTDAEDQAPPGMNQMQDSTESAPGVGSAACGCVDEDD